MLLPLIPSSLISILAILAGLLAFIAIVRFPDVPGSLRIGLIVTAPALIGLGFIYFYFTSYDVETDVRTIAVRIGLLYMLTAFNFWQIILHIRGGK